MLRRAWAAWCVTLVLAACGDASGPAAPGATVAGNADGERLLQIADSYYERWLELNPLVATAQGDHRYDAKFGDYASPMWLANLLAAEQDALEELRTTIDPSQLSPDDRVTYDAFKYGREIAIEGFRYPTELLPIDPISNLATRFAILGAGTGAQPFATRADYEHFLARMDGFVAWVDQVIVDLKLGADKGVVLPKVLVEALLPQLDDLGVQDPRQSLFWRPILSFPAGLAVADRKRFTDAYAQKLADGVLPAYRRLHDYLETEYLGRARDTVSWSELPAGDSWYAYRVRLYTTTNMTPQEAHELGLAEIARLRGDLQRIAQQLGHHGDLRGFFDALRADPRFRDGRPEDLLERYGALRERVSVALPVLFATRPRAQFELRAVEPYRARSAGGASYEPGSVDGRRPGIFYVNTFDLVSRPSYLIEATYLHQAAPGRHFQGSLAQESEKLPRVRRFGSDPAYVEGWGLYAETLGSELGLYTDVYGRLGAVAGQALHAAGIVVDTGLHAKGWSRERAMDYLRANVPMGDAALDAAVDRSIAVPGEALAARIGQLKLSELKRRAQKKLGARFDPRAFHTEVLRDGPLPLAVLEAKVDRWIEARAK